MYKEGHSKRGQVAIFVIVGVVIIMGIFLFFFLTGSDRMIDNPPSESPQNFIDQCVTTSVEPSLDLVFAYGGSVGPRNFILRDDVEYNYLCFTDRYYAKCVNNYPMLHRYAQEEIRRDSVERVRECFSLLVDDYESRGYSVSERPLNYTVQIVPGSLRLQISKPLVFTKESNVNTFDVFNMRIASDLYDIIGIARSIVNSEAEHCYFESNGFMVLYPTYNLTRIDYVESKLYELQNRQTKETFKFATRSCPFAPGF